MQFSLNIFDKFHFYLWRGGSTIFPLNHGQQYFITIYRDPQYLIFFFRNRKFENHCSNDDCGEEAHEVILQQFAKGTNLLKHVNHFNDDQVSLSKNNLLTAFTGWNDKIVTLEKPT